MSGNAAPLGRTKDKPQLLLGDLNGLKPWQIEIGRVTYLISSSWVLSSRHANLLSGDWIVEPAPDDVVKLLRGFMPGRTVKLTRTPLVVESMGGIKRVFKGKSVLAFVDARQDELLGKPAALYRAPEPIDEIVFLGREPGDEWCAGVTGLTPTSQATAEMELDRGLRALGFAKVGERL